MRITDGSCEVTDQEIAELPTSSQCVLKILKARGAPVIGGCMLCLDVRYRWFVTEDRRKHCVEYTWKSKED